MADFDSLAEEIRKQLDSSVQYWLFGAGISAESNIPLMIPLTQRVKCILDKTSSEQDREIYKSLSEDLSPEHHIEHYLSHVGDLIALAERSHNGTAEVHQKEYLAAELRHLHGAITSAIGNTIRYGYTNTGTEKIGTAEEPIVTIENHLNFVKVLFEGRSNLLSRSKITFFTINYDTLLEDALALQKYIVSDGFSGGAVAFWNPENEFTKEKVIPNTVNLYKLHGSIDWYRDEEHGLVRTRYGTRYLSNPSDIMIYPQATKYVETQKDPFACLFAGFRNSLGSKEDNILITCGYSFGDDHINAEIEAALRTRGNRTTLLAFVKEAPNVSNGIVVNKTIDKWLENTVFGNRVYVAGKGGVYYNTTTPFRRDDVDLSWWTFSGLSEYLATGEPL